MFTNNSVRNFVYVKPLGAIETVRRFSRISSEDDIPKIFPKYHLSTERNSLAAWVHSHTEGVSGQRRLVTRRMYDAKGRQIGDFRRTNPDPTMERRPVVS